MTTGVARGRPQETLPENQNLFSHPLEGIRAKRNLSIHFKPRTRGLSEKTIEKCDQGC